MARLTGWMSLVSTLETEGQAFKYARNYGVALLHMKEICCYRHTCIFIAMKVKLLSRPIFATPMDCGLLQLLCPWVIFQVYYGATAISGADEFVTDELS